MPDSQVQDEALAEIAQQLDVLARNAPPVDHIDGQPLQTNVSFSFDVPGDTGSPGDDQPDDDVTVVYWKKVAAEIAKAAALAIGGAIAGVLGLGDGESTCTTRTTTTETQAADGTKTKTTTTTVTCVTPA